jgi:signal recognition particle subunit SEC65
LPVKIFYESQDYHFSIMRKKSRAIFWLAYFDKRLTRKQGRRLSKNDAVDKLTLEQLAEAARVLGFDADLDPEARFPASWSEHPGRIIVNTEGQVKSKVLQKIGKQLRKMASPS